MKKYLKYVRYILLVIAAGAVFFMVYSYVGFSQKGLNTWLVGQTAEDHYSNWDGAVDDVYEADRNILNKAHIFFSKVFVIKRSDSYQIRFRFAYSIPFMHDSLLQDTDWLKLVDSDGNDYQDCLTVYSSKITALSCIDATLTMDEDMFSELSGSGKLTVSVVCTEAGLNTESSYAGCEVEILIPGMN